MKTCCSQSKPKTGLVELFLIYLKLGCISFGGPTAHLAYFNNEFVTRRGWLKEHRYAELLSFCQFVPGPSSSQLGFAIAWNRSGLRGAFIAWSAFTLPSAFLMTAFAMGLVHFAELLDAAISGLLVATIAIVADATLRLKKTLCPDRPRGLIAVATATCLLYLPGNLTQLSVILIGGLVGQFIPIEKTRPTNDKAPELRFNNTLSTGAIVTFFVLLLASFALTTQTTTSIYTAHYKAGALVFGGGHVVLPLLENGIVDSGIVTDKEFLVGYSTAQTLPGPLFSFAAFLGTIGGETKPPFVGGFLALAAIFLPGILLLVGLLPRWDSIRSKDWAQAALHGANAAVVGLLAAALIDPVCMHGIQSIQHLTIAVLSFLSLHFLKVPAWSIVLCCAITGHLFL